MIHQITKAIDSVFSIKTVSAHCDVPCGIYDPSTMQVAALSVIRFIDQINELDGKELTLADHAKLARLVAEKETHAAKVKEEVRIVWGDYFKAAQFEACPGTNELVHSIMLAGSKCKQTIDRAAGEELLKLVNEFAVSFWKTKGVETFTATCPYPPALDVVYPKLG
ncbi:superoxide dismutase, Ni ['Osedax' symbiont bacterium Rs2_46_30_T18]|nr:superoxide dismutase, Ni ['Osedax' symbiont bacterium Rs2_46_30_T18]